MPQKAWSAKRESRNVHIKLRNGARQRGLKGRPGMNMALLEAALSP